jgi:hypothetical protein
MMSIASDASSSFSPSISMVLESEEVSLIIFTLDAITILAIIGCSLIIISLVVPCVLQIMDCSVIITSFILTGVYFLAWDLLPKVPYK